MKAKTKNSLIPWIMWGYVILFFFYQFFVRVYPSALSNQLMNFFCIDANTLGMMVGLYYLSYTFMQVPIGILLDKFGPRKVSVISVLCCAFGSYLFIAIDNFYLACFGRLLAGLGSAGGFCACLKVASNWLNAKQLNIATTGTLSFGVLGAIAGIPAFAHMVTIFDWRTTVIITSLVGVAVAVIIFLRLKDSPDDDKKNVVEKKETVHVFEGLRMLICSKRIWIYFLYGFLMYAPISAFADMWGIPMIKSMYNFSDTYTAFVVSSFYIGMVFGPVLSYIAEKFDNENVLMFVGSLSSAIVFYFIIFIKMNSILLIASIAFCGFITSSQMFIYPMAIRQLPHSVSGVTSGFLNMAGMLSGSILQPVIGKIIVLFWSGELINNITPLYSTYSYQMGMLIVPVLLLISVPVAILIGKK